MLNVNINTLSDIQLRYIASQEDIDDYSNLSREELIEELEELFEEPSEKSLSSRKYSAEILSSRKIEKVSKLNLLPLPERYNENIINVVMRDSSWCYVLWNLSIGIMSKIENNPAYGVAIRFTRSNGRDEFNSFDIVVDKQDSSLNFEIYNANIEYRASVVIINNETSTEEVLCTSEPFGISDFCLKDAEFSNQEKFKAVYLDSFISKDGKMVNCRPVYEAIQHFVQENSK